MEKFIPKNGPVYLRLGLTLVVIPTTILFFHYFHGPSVAEAWSQTLDVFFFSGSMVWLIIFGSMVGFFAYLFPAFKAETKSDAELAVRRINFLPLLVLGINVFSFLLGATFEILTGYTRGFGSIGSVWLIIEASVSALASSSLMLLHFDAYLFPIKRKILALEPSIPFRYSSLYGRILLGLTGLVFFLFFQSLSTSSNFLLLGTSMPSGFGALTPRLDTMRPDAILNTAIGMTGMRGAVQVVGIRSLLFFSLAVDTLYLIKTLIKSPLWLIQRSLTGLAQEEVRDTPTLDLVNNDEFLPVFSQINQLIQKQRGVIEDSKAHIDDIVRGAPDPILSFTTEGSIHLANPGARRFFGLTDGSLETMRVQDLFSPDLESVRSSQGAWELSSMIDLFEKAKNLPVRIGGKIGDGTWVPIEVTISQVQAHSTNLYTLIARDLRSQVETERVLLEARVAAEKANRMKSEFLANMSHELRTPLNAVLGFTQLLEGDQNLTSGQKSKLGIISRSGEHLLGLINDILDISKIEAGKFELRNDAFDIRQLIEDMKEMFSLRATSKGLVLDMELIEPCPQYVQGDLGKLRQVLINLLGNSVKFTDLGGIGLVVGPEHDRISFVVRDTGRGIPPDEIKTILQPFRQSSLNHNEGGTGLGLAITQRFVEMMGGELQIESEEGKGSTFRFSLPLPIVNSTPKEEREQRAIIGVRGTIPRALVVDDKVENRLVLKEMLERVGMSCMEAENGKEAIERFTSYNPDLVFMDIKMPVMDGYKAAQEIRILSADKVPLFALTASAFTHDEEKIRNVGFTDYLSKPFKQSSIFALLENHTSIDFIYEEDSPRKEDSNPISLEDLDVTVLKEIVGTDFWDSLEECIIINDFSGIGQLSSLLDDPKTEDLSVFLRQRVDQFDERGLDSLIRKIRGGSYEF